MLDFFYQIPPGSVLAPLIRLLCLYSSSTNHLPPLKTNAGAAYGPTKPGWQAAAACAILSAISRALSAASPASSPSPDSLFEATSGKTVFPSTNMLT